MEIFDPLYGKFELEQISKNLCILPEVRRLSQIRLLNSITPTLATLSELRRYAHTLGVIHLFTLWKKAAGRRFAKADVDALEVAIILHDIATPPFGHLFEYVLKDSLGWDHESAAVSALLKAYGPASTGQQIFAGRTPKVLDYVERSGIDLDKVKSILSKKHILSGLIFGVVDFDNLDNVWRMSWALGLPEARGEGPEALAQCLDVSADGGLRITSGGAPLLRKWASLRRRVYEVLIFDQSTIASQTLLTYAIKTGIARGLISPDDWFLHDESLLLKLSADKELRELIERQYLGQLPLPVLTVQIQWREAPFFTLARSEIEKISRESVEHILGTATWLYAFKEKGSFEKEVHYVDTDGAAQRLGETSRSIVVSIFSDRLLSSQQSRAVSQAFLEMLTSHDISSSDLLQVIVSGKSGNPSNARFDF